MPGKHEHDWQPDGESWKDWDHTDTCSFIHDRLGIKCDDGCSYTLKRRYTCYCGDVKVVEYNA